MFRTVHILYLISWTCILASVLGDGCPYKECECFEDVIECENMNLKALPTVIIPELSWEPLLALEDNFITNISREGLPSGLGGIDFEGNPITFVAEDAFDGSEHTLEDLKFSRVNLDELPFALFYLKNLKHLSIKNSQIRQWDEDLVFFLGSTLQTLTLDDAGLTDWPSSISSMTQLTSLEFSNTPVSIPDGTFNGLYQALESITLRNISLTSTMNLFSNLTNLTTLVLENNSISQVTGLPIGGKLYTLNLNNNSITDKTNLSEALRPVAKSLSYLSLSFNVLETLPDLTFMTNLGDADFTSNQIYNTRLGAVPASLTSLLLDNNIITSTSNFMRTGLQLQIVKLGSNFITEIQGVDIPPSVTDIDFTSNLITELKETSFPLNSSMVGLSLDFNPISRISSSAFTNLKHLSHLSLKGSKLLRLPTSVGLLNSLRVLDLSGSTGLVCTCAESSLRRWAMSVSPTISGDCGLASIDYFLQTLSSDCPD